MNKRRAVGSFILAGLVAVAAVADGGSGRAPAPGKGGEEAVSNGGKDAAAPGNGSEAAVADGGKVLAHGHSVAPGNGEVVVAPGNGEVVVAPGNGEVVVAPGNGVVAVAPGNGVAVVAGLILAVVSAAIALGALVVRMRFTAEIERERFHVQTLLDNIPDHIYFKDCQSRFVRINTAMARAFKLARAEEAVGKTDFDFFLAEHARQAFEDEQSIVRTGEPLVNREEKETWPDGSVTWVSTTKVALRDKQGKVVGTFGISRDITGRKRAEEALAQTAQDLARSNRDLEQFAYVASHDLQEPLRMIASYLQLLDRRYQEKLDAAGREFLAFAVDGAKRLQSLIHDLLLYSRVGREGQAVQWIEAEQTLARALKNLKFAIDESRARITHGPLPRILADETEMTQLFQNLIGNAIKFRRGESPDIHITAELRKAAGAAAGGLAAPRGQEWVFAVTDNGIGIEPEYFQRIFVIFQRLHTREEIPGTGIGLALCKRIVDRHGGRIWVESQPQKGSTFWFSLPQPESLA